MPKTRADWVPSEPIRNAVRKWLKEHGSGEPVAQSEKRTGAGENRKHSTAHEILSERIGCKPDYVAKIAKGRHDSMRFDTADKILCAIGKCELWWQDPTLAVLYEKAVVAADRINPIIEPEPDTRICDYCNEEFTVLKKHGYPRRFCSHACRQAAYMARKQAA